MHTKELKLMKKDKQTIISLFTLILFASGAAFAEMAIPEPPELPTKKVEKSKKQQTKSIYMTEQQWRTLEKLYRPVTKEKNVIQALELLKSSVGAYSRDAILGANLTQNPIKIEFKDLTKLNPSFKDFDAAGSKVRSRLYININEKHKDAPPAALAALLAHEALHQDAYNSINEEVYAWKMEAAVWTQLCEKYPDKVNVSHPLVRRENDLKKLFEKGDYSEEYIRKSIISNPAYKNLPSRSPGFEDRL